MPGELEPLFVISENYRGAYDGVRHASIDILNDFSPYTPNGAQIILLVQESIC